ncbi:hypothetical protein [Comamonas sp. Tr-654]|uniref:hypothetical protein n=1 Tax=Comamonas sp. Tr-654 TaxID=2608341 RepID=UPI001F040FAA|nr:hypothetical protein [Comamonas sp. Tr-654]
MKTSLFEQIVECPGSAPDAEIDPDPDPAASPASVPQAQAASLQAQLIGDSLSRHVPAMQSGFEIMTSQGLWRVDGELARQMAELMRRHLMKQLESA